jgi:hypothetical protein
MDPLQIIAAIIGIGANIPLFIGIYKNKVEQSFAAFMLWALLDIIAATTTILQHGNYMLPLGYAFTASAIAILLVVKKQTNWSWVESTTSLLVLACLIIWYMAGDKAGTIASSLAVVIAAIPQGVDTFKKPESTPTNIYFWFVVANVLSFIAGKSWTVEERFYSGCVVFLTIVLFIFSMKKTKPQVA